MNKQAFSLPFVCFFPASKEKRKLKKKRKNPIGGKELFVLAIVKVIFSTLRNASRILRPPGYGK